MGMKLAPFGDVKEEDYFIASDENGENAIFRRNGKFGIRYQVREDKESQRMMLERSGSSRMKRRLEFDVSTEVMLLR